MPLLCIQGLAYRVDGRDILACIDVEVRKGEIHALLGANGAGKTTLPRIVMGCAGYAPSAGRVQLEGRDLAGLALHARAAGDNAFLAGAGAVRGAYRVPLSFAGRARPHG
ncbi:MAG: ATP-binding cassette domain-containing protein, partial [Burkholderiales bacterium]